jgi:hypothetical protein
LRRGPLRIQAPHAAPPPPRFCISAVRALGAPPARAPRFMIGPRALQGSLPVQGSKNSKARLQVGASETCPDYVGARQRRSSNPTRRPGPHRGLDVVGPARRRVSLRAPPGRHLRHRRGARPPPGQPPPTGSVFWRHLALVSPALPASRICSAAAENITRPLRCRQASCAGLPALVRDPQGAALVCC